MNTHTCIASTFVVCLVVLGTTTAFAAPGDLLWYQHEGREYRDLGRSICALPDGSVLVHGWCENYYQADQPELYRPAGMNLRIIFLSKYSSDGQLQWLKLGGSAHCDTGGSISALPNGTFVMAGDFSYGGVPGHFGYGEPNSTVLYSHGVTNGPFDIVIAKYNSDGTLQWARCAGGDGYDWVDSVAIAPDGSCYVLGAVQGSGKFGERDGIDENDVTFTAPEGSTYAYFIARYDANGVLQFVQPRDSRYGVVAMPDSSCLFGTWTEIIRLAPDGSQTTFAEVPTGPAVDLERAPNGDIVALALSYADNSYAVERYSAGGTLLWKTVLAGTNTYDPVDLSLFSDGTAVVAAGLGTLYYVRSDGSLAPQQSLGTDVEFSQIAAVDADGTVAMTGAVWSTTTLGTGASAAVLQPRGSGDIMVAKYQAMQQWRVRGTAEGYGCVQIDPATGVCFDGAPVTISAQPLFEGYAFDHWEGDLSGYTNPVVSLTVNSDITFKAVFTASENAGAVPVASIGGLMLLAFGLGVAALRKR